MFSHNPVVVERIPTSNPTGTRGAAIPRPSPAIAVPTMVPTVASPRCCALLRLLRSASRILTITWLSSWLWANSCSSMAFRASISEVELAHRSQSLVAFGRCISSCARPVKVWALVASSDRRSRRRRSSLRSFRVDSRALSSLLIESICSRAFFAAAAGASRDACRAAAFPAPPPPRTTPPRRPR